MKETTKMKIGLSLRGRKRAATTKHLISVSLKGRNKSKEHRRAISEAMKRSWAKRHKDLPIRETKLVKKQEK